jgi:hypothetical protein
MQPSIAHRIPSAGQARTPPQPPLGSASDVLELDAAHSASSPSTCATVGVISSLSDSNGRRPRPARGVTTWSSTKTYSAVRAVRFSRHTLIFNARCPYRSPPGRLGEVRLRSHAVRRQEQGQRLNRTRQPLPARALGEAAVGAARTSTILGERNRRPARHRGKKKAVVAVGRSILLIIARPATEARALGEP